MKLKLPKFNKKLFFSVNFILLLVFLNFALSLIYVPKLDLTKNKIHTLSPVSRQIVKELKDKLEVTVYQSDNLPPQLQPDIDTLKNILSQLSSYNSNHFIVTYKNPNTSQDIKKEASEKGVQAIQFSTIQDDSFQLNNAYFGLVVSFADKQEVMPTVSDVSSIEYFIISTIKKLTSQQILTISLGVGHGQVDPSQLRIFGQYLSQLYSPAIVDTDSDNWQIPPNNLFILFSPSQDFSEDEINKLKDHLSQGFPILIFFDQFQVTNSLIATKVDTPNFLSFLKEYGFEVGDSIIVDQSSTIANFSTQTNQITVRYPYWLSIRPENINTNLPVSRNISSLDLKWASPININDKATFLLKSSQQSYTSQDTNLSPLNQYNFESEDLFQSTVAAINTNDVKIALISDVDFIKDDFINNQSSLQFVLNLSDYLNSDEQLLGIRNKVLESYPLKITTNSQKQIIRWSALASIPLLLLVAFFVSKKIQSKSHIRKS